MSINLEAGTKILDYYRLVPPQPTVAAIRAIDTTPFVQTGIIVACVETETLFVWDQASSDADDGGITTIAPTTGSGRWKRKRAVPSSAANNSVLFIDNSGNIKTSSNLSYFDSSSLLSVLNFQATSIIGLEGARVFPSQLAVTSNRAVLSSDLGAVLCAFGATRTLTLPEGSTGLKIDAAFSLFKFESSFPLSVTAPAGVKIDGVDGGTVSTEKTGDFVTVFRNHLNKTEWHTTRKSKLRPNQRDFTTVINNGGRNLTADDVEKRVFVENLNVFTIITIPAGLVNPFYRGATIIIDKLGLGTVNITAGAGVSLNGSIGNTVQFPTQYDSIRLIAHQQDVWYAQTTLHST